MTSATSSDSEQVTGSTDGSYGSKTSVYVSIGSSSRARPSRSRSTSGSGPASGSNRSSGITSTIAPRRPPASSSCDTSSSSIDTARSGSVPFATSLTAMMKLSICAEMSAVNSLRSSDIEQSSPLERTPERNLVRVLQVATDRQSAGQPCHFQAHRLDEPGEVRRGGLALQVRVRREDQLGD